MTSNPPDETPIAEGLKLDFPSHARELALHWGRRWMLGISAAAILWWPTDPFVFADSPESQVVFAWIRGLGLVFHLVVYALLTWVPWVRRRALLVLSVYGSVAIMLPAFALSHLGGPDEGWFGYLYLALIPGAFVQLPLRQRIPANTFPAVTAALAYFGLHPEYLSHEQAASSLSYLVFAAALSIGLGVVLYGVVHRAYLQAVALARTSAALQSLNRELEARAQEQARDLRALAGEASQVREDERTRIARELHDELGQELTAARMALTLARRKHARDPDVLSQSLSELETLLARTAQTTRDLVSQLRPRAVDELGLGPAVERLVSELTDKTGVSIRCAVSGDLGDLDPERRTAVYRFVQEGLTNALRHAQATTISVSLSADQVVRCIVEDDGVGLRPGRPAGHGLVGLRERAIALGGTFELGARGPDERGTRLVLTFPRTSA